MNCEKLKNLTYTLKKTVDALENVEDEKIKTSLIEAARETTKEILALLTD